MTYVGPRAFVIVFCTVCGIFLAIFFGVGALTAPPGTAASDSAENGSAPAGFPATTTATIMPAPRLSAAGAAPSAAPAAVSAVPAAIISPVAGRTPLGGLNGMPLAQQNALEAAKPARPTRALASIRPRSASPLAARTAARPSPAKLAVPVGIAPVPAPRASAKAAAESAARNRRAVVKELLLVPFESATLDHGSGQLMPRASARGSLIIAASPPPAPRSASAALP